MPANTTGIEMGYLAGRYQGKLAHLFSPDAQHGPFPHIGMTYALDNGAFGCWVKKMPFDQDAWLALLMWARDAGQAPRWVLVPDSVGDRQSTLAMWSCWADVAAGYGWPLAFAAQDGMTPDDVPMRADVVFLGGSTAWKWSSLTAWCKAFPRVHVGRVNGLKGLRLCAEAGAESVDGTGFGRTRRQWHELHYFLAEQAGERPRPEQQLIFSESTDDQTEAGSESCAIGEQGLYGEVMRNIK
jgi:hypothetical protein